jgi:hypothetical protein
MTISQLPHSDGAVRATCESQDPAEPHNVPSNPSSFNLEIEAPVGKLKLSAQGRATVAVVVAFLVTGALVGIGGSAFLNHSQPNQPTVESHK